MKINTYRANGLQRLFLSVKVKGVAQNIVFGGGGYSPRRYGMFRTGNADIQKALEKHPSFNRTFHLEDTEYIAEPAPAKVEEKPLEFNNFNELRDYPIKEHGKAPITVSTQAKADKMMQKLNLKYSYK